MSKKTGEQRSTPREKGSAPPKGEEVFRAKTPQDVTSTRAKSSRHKKSTADKWNQ